MLNTAFRLESGVDSGSGRSCSSSEDSPKPPWQARIPAAVAASLPELFFDSVCGLESAPFGSGLRLLLESECLADGDRERRSKREFLLASGSV